jgi:RIP metalloprotease RseP
VNEGLKASGGNVVITAARLDPKTAKPVAESIDYGVVLASSELDGLKNIRYAHELYLRDRIEPRKTSNPFLAAGWGVTETRDLLLQFYLTLQRLATGSVSATNLMGPLGIVHAGSKFAIKGNDWLIWFLAMISANLAVVNFLPIPIVDGGLFTFLIIEKIAGKPLSPRMQTVAQLVGMAIILSVFVLVTYQDISRLWL